MRAVGAVGGPVAGRVGELDARIGLARSGERVVLLERIRHAHIHALAADEIGAGAVDHVRVVAQPELALEVIVLPGRNRQAGRQVGRRRHGADDRDAVAIPVGDVEVPHAGLLADGRQLGNPLLDALAPALRVLVLGAHREPALRHRVEGEAELVVGRGLEDPVGPVFSQPGEANPRGRASARQPPDVGIDDMALEAELLRVDWRGQRRRRVVVGHPLAPAGTPVSGC